MDSDPSQTTKPPQKPLELPRDFALSVAEQYAKKVAAGEIKPSKEDLRGFLPQKGIGGGRMTGTTRASDAKLEAVNKATKEADKDKLTLSALVPRLPRETALIENTGFEAAAKQQGDDLAMASAALVATINTDSMFFRGMKLHQKILAGERAFEIDKESGLMTEKGKMDAADYEYFYDHPNRQITMLHGAAEVLSMLGSEVGHTFQHLAGDATPVLNPYYKDKPNWPELQEEAKAFVMQGVTLKIGVDELKSGKANKDNAISVAEMSGREVREVHAERSKYIELYKRYVNPPEVKGKDGKVFTAQPLFVDPSFWESTGNKTMGAVEAGTRVLKGWYNLAADASKDPLSWHGSADDKLRHLSLEHEYQFVKDDPSKQDEARKLLAQIKDVKSIRAVRMNTAADDIASMNKWASGDYMVWAPHKANSFEVDPAAGPGIRPDPNIWSPGQAWMDPIMIYGLGSGAFRAMKAASAAKASMLSRYVAIAKLASVESFALDVATIAKGLAGMDDFMKATGLEAAADAGMDAAKLSQEQLIEMGLRRILENPMALNPAKFTTKLIDDVLNSFPKPAAVAMTEEQWQLLSGIDKLRNLDPPVSFAGVPEGPQVWANMSVEQRMQVIMGEKTSEVYKLARQRQVAAIASAQADTARTAAETANTNSNAGVVRRTAGKFTSIFGEYVMGGRELGRGFWRDLSVAGLLNGSADIVENALRGGVSATLGKDAGLKVEEFLRDQSKARYVFRAQVAIGSALGINIADSVFGENQTWLKYPKYMINTLGFIAGARVLGYNSQSIGKFIKVWGDEIARGDPTLWRGYAAKIAKNPEAYGFDPKEVMGPKGIANFVANFGVEGGLRFGKQALYDFGVKGGGVAELMVYGKDRDSKGQGLAIGTAFSAVGYYMALGVNKGLGRTRINAMRSDAMNRIGMTMEGDPTNLMMFIKAHETALKGGFEEDFLGFVLGVDNSTKAKIRFIDGKSANMLRFAYDYGMINQAESIRKMVALGFRTPEDIIGAKLKQEEFGKIATELRNKMTEESRVLTLDFEAQRDVARQLTDKLKDPRLTTEEKMDIGTQKMMVQARIKQIKIRNGEIAQSLKIGDNLTFIRANGIDPATVNARVRAGVNEITGNPLITFKGLTIESTKDGPIVYMNVDRLTTKAMWHEAAEAVILAGGIETVVKDATLKLFGNMGKNPATMQENKRVVDEALKAGNAVDTYEFFTTKLVHQATKDGVLNPALIADMIRAHAKSANLDGAWEANAFSAVREYLTTGDQTAISSLTREIFANYVGLHLEQTTTLAGTPNKLALFENGSWGMTLYGFSERILNSMKGDTALSMEGHNQLAVNANAQVGNWTSIRSFFTDPATGKRITITALERLSREAIKRSGKEGLDAEGRALVDLRKLQPEERRAWVTANNVSHWVDESGNLRDPKEIVRIEAGMMNQSIMELERIRSDNPNIVRGVKKVEKNKNGETHTITGNLSAPEIMVMLNNPDVPENIKKTLLAYSKAVFRSDGQIGLIQGMYSGESKEIVYTPQSTPSLREWGSPLLAPEHRALLPLSLTVAWETDNAGAIVAARVNVNGLDWKKGIEPRVRIAAGSDLAKANNLTMSDLYGYMRDYITNLNKGTNNKPGTYDNAIPSAELFDPTGNNPTRGENIRDLMHFIFDFQKKKGDAYINQPGDWGELGLRGPTHPYTTFSAHRWTGAEADADGRFIRVNDAAYKLSQGNFMGAAEDNVPPKKLNRADVGEQSPDKEAEAVQRAGGPETTIDPPIEKGKVVDPTSSIELNPAIALEQISDVYSLNGEAIPKVVSNWIKAYEKDLINRPPKTTEEYVRRLHDIAYEKSRQSVGLNIGKAEKERAQYAKPILSKLYFKVKELADAKRAQIDAEKRGIVQANTEATAAEAAAIDAVKDVNTNAARQGDAAKNVPTPMSNAVRKDLEMANDQISMWREIVDQGLKDEAGGVEVSLFAAELPYNQKQLRKYLDIAYSIKENFDPGFDVATYFPDYKKPDLRQDVQAAINAEAAAVRQVEVANTPTGQANMPLVGQFKDKATDAFTRLAVMRLPGSKDIPDIISTLMTSSNSFAKKFTLLLDVLEGNKGTVDYVYAADAAAKYSKSIDLMIQAQSKAETAALKAGNKDKAKLAVDVRTQLEVLKNTVDGIQEYAQDLADTSPARQIAAKPKPAPAPDISPQLEASTEPTTTSKPKLSDKEIKSRLKELEGKLEEMYELDSEGEDSSGAQDKAQEVITALRNAGVEPDVIQDIIDNSDVGADYGWTFNPSTPKGGSGSGAKPPKPPKPTANAAGADDVPDLPKPKTPKVPDHVVPDAPLIDDPDLGWVDLNNPKKDPNDIKRYYGTKVRKRIDDDLAAVLDAAETRIKTVMDMVRKKGVGFDSKDVIEAYNSLESALLRIEKNQDTTVTDYGIDMFDLSPKVRQRFGDLFELETSEWWSKSQKTRQKNVLKQTKDYKDRLLKIAADRVMSDMLGQLSTQTIEKIGDPKKGNYQSVMNILSKKMPWIMADDRTLLPLTTAIDNFIVTERVVDPDAKTGTGGTNGLIFIDKTAKTAFGEPAMYNIMNNIMGTHFWGYRNNGFMDLQVLNVNGDRRVFRISTQGTRGISAKELQKLYAEAVKEQQASKRPGSPMPALKFDTNGKSFNATKGGLLLMNAEIEGFLREGQVKKNEGDRIAGARQQQDLKKQQREAEAKAKANVEVLAAAEKTKQAQLRIGLYGRQPVDPNNPNTAMAVVDGHKTVVSRRADSLVEVHKSKDKEGYTFYRVEYLGDDFGGPRQILRTASQDIAMNLAQSFTPFGGWRDAVLNIVDGLSVPESGPWPGRDGNPTNDPKMVKSLADMVKTRDAEFADAITRIRASGTYGVIDMGQGEVLVVPKKSLRDKKGNLYMSQAVKLSRRLIFQVQTFAQQGEAAQAARQAANARLPAPRIDPATGRPLAPGGKPAPTQAPAPAQGQAPLPVQEFTNDRVNGILQTARNTQSIAKAEAVSTVLKILTNKDNFKIMYMKNGTIRVYGVNNNLLAVTDDEETAFSWLTK